MLFFVRAVVYGFGMSLGSALFKKVQDRIGLGEPKDPEDQKSKEPAEPDAVGEAAPDPNLPR
jgi:hypothetical protein